MYKKEKLFLPAVAVLFTITTIVSIIVGNPNFMERPGFLGAEKLIVVIRPLNVFFFFGGLAFPFISVVSLVPRWRALEVHSRVLAIILLGSIVVTAPTLYLWAYVAIPDEPYLTGQKLMPWDPWFIFLGIQTIGWTSFVIVMKLNAKIRSTIRVLIGLFIVIIIILVSYSFSPTAQNSIVYYGVLEIAPFSPGEVYWPLSQFFITPKFLSYISVALIVGTVWGPLARWLKRLEPEGSTLGTVTNKAPATASVPDDVTEGQAF